MNFSQSFSEDCRLIRQHSPLVHNITNYVAMNFTANVLLAAGASPLMSSEPDEMEDICAHSSSLAVNIGCIERRQEAAMMRACSAALSGGKPWVLDPAGVGISGLRTDLCSRLISCYHPDVIRGNSSEIMFLAGTGEPPHGLDSLRDSSAALESAVSLARRAGTVVCVSGPEDYITDGTSVICISNGSQLMSAVSAMGCAASSLVAAFLAVDSSPFRSCASAMALMGVAGEMAEMSSRGPGSFVPAFLDSLHSIVPEEASRNLRYEQRSA